jgi:transposase
MAIRAIGRRLGISRNTVKKALASHEPPRYVRVSAGSVMEAQPA